MKNYELKAHMSCVVLQVSMNDLFPHSSAFNNKIEGGKHR